MEGIQTSTPSSRIEGGQQKDDAEETFERLPQEMSRSGIMMGYYKGFWFPHLFFEPLMSMHKLYQPFHTDIILATFPKSGTTWLKALAFSIINRHKYSTELNPLLHSNPHKLVPFFEHQIYAGTRESLTINHMDSPRLFATHTPYQCLPATILHSSCRVVYLSRNLLDVINSYRHFIIENGFHSGAQAITLEEYMEPFFEGKHAYGPYWDHMLGYWNASLKNPDKVLFLKYEDLRRDATPLVKKMANFLGYPFSREEEESGVVEEIIKLCSFENLGILEANKTGNVENLLNAKTSSFFRKGKVGDWKNHLTPSMAERLQNLVNEKFAGSGLTIEVDGT